MKTVALISGGKDSCFNMMQCAAEGHDIVALANLRPNDKDELDSYMFQTVGHHAIDLYAEAMGLPLYRRVIQGSSVECGWDYHRNEEDEVEDLYALLEEVKAACGVEAVSVGAILSEYQRIRVEHVCARLGLTVLAFLWRRDQEDLLSEMCQCGLKAILIKVAALGLDPEKHLGLTLEEIRPHMIKMKSKFGLNVCGEGGEYETFTLDCPLFKKRIVLDEFDKVMHSDDAFAPVAYLNLRKMHLENKTEQSVPPTNLSELPMLRSSQLMEHLFGEEEVTEEQGSASQVGISSASTTDLKGDYFHFHEDGSGYFSLSGLMARTDPSHEIEDATRVAMDTMKAVLIDKGYSLQDLAALYLYVSDMGNFAKVNSVYKTYFSLNPPARVCVQASLPANVLLQIDGVGYRHTGPLSRHTMHVQGLSHWAPANIGPYSQATKVGDVTFVAGQIGMQPSDLHLISGGVRPQSRLSLRHVTRVLHAMPGSPSLANVVSAICYVSSAAYISCAQEEWKRAHQDDEVDEGGVNSLLSFVVVPGLPKSALVEWQVYSCTSTAGTGGHVSRQMPGYTAAADFQCCLGQPSVCGIRAVVKNDGSNQDSSTEKILRLLLDTVMSVKQQVDGEFKQLMEQQEPDEEENNHQVIRATYRIFYHQDRFQMEDLYKSYTELQTVLQGADGPGASFIPALGFQEEDTVLLLCT